VTFQLIGSSGTAAVHSAPKTVERVSAARLPTEVGEFRIAGYRSKTSDEEFVALYKGEIRADVPTLARIHSQCLTGDVFGSTKCDCGAARPVEIVGRGRPSGA
jgi:3,4-dihydroxy 2-butanone 4-phosphate synthase/GTP cyclohydrolase II